MVTVQDICEHLINHGMPTEVEGDATRRIAAVATLEEATQADVSFLANRKYEKALAETAAGAVILNEDASAPDTTTALRTADPYAAVTAAIVLIHGHRQHPQWGVHDQATISPSATLGAHANIGPHAVIEDDVVIGDHAVVYPGAYVGRGCRVGHNVVLYPSVVLYENTILGDRVSIHAGTIIGEDGLGYAPVAGEWVKIPQAGTVIIEDDVEIGASCTIDRATLGSTVIGRGCKFSNLIAIGHGTKIGTCSLLVAQVGVAGSVHVGEHVQIGGQVGVAGHLTIGNDVRIGAKAGVIADIAPGEHVLGQPAIPARDARRAASLTAKLPDMRQRLKAMEAELAALREALESKH